MSFQERKAKEFLDEMFEELEGHRQALKSLQAQSEEASQRKQRLLQELEELSRRETQLAEKKERLLQERRQKQDEEERVERERQENLRAEIKRLGKEQKRKMRELEWRPLPHSPSPPEDQQLLGAASICTTTSVATSDFTGISGIEPVGARASLFQTQGKSYFLRIFQIKNYKYEGRKHILMNPRK